MFDSAVARLRQALADPDVAIDLGTANTRLYAQGRGLIADEPSLVKVRADTRAVISVGARAIRRNGSDHTQHLLAPLRAGVIADVDAATALLTPLLRRARWLGLFRPRVLACAPTDACPDEREALIEATRRAGASAIVIVPEPLAAAIGSGMDVTSEYARMIVDIGDGVTDIAVISSGSLVTTAALRIACSDLLVAVSRVVRENHGIELYRREAERLIRQVGAGRAGFVSSPFVVAGADCRTGLLKRVPVSGQIAADAIRPALSEIISFIGRTVRELPPELACEVIESGIVLTGGGAFLHRVSEAVAAETSLTVRLARDPMRAVINGARQMLSVGAATHLWGN